MLNDISFELNQKYEDLKRRIAMLGSCAVAFSSGVDSALLLYAAKEALGSKAVAVTAIAPFFPERESDESRSFCKEIGVDQVILEINPEDIPEFESNPKDRCYHCKLNLFNNFMDFAASRGLSAVIEGSNADDVSDYRPGMKALAELDIKSPLKEAGLTKDEIRTLSKAFGLPTWNKPSFACLASRIPYGEKITRDKLSIVESAEKYLLELGFKQFRVRFHEELNGGKLARLEVLPGDFARFESAEFRNDIYDRFKGLGFSYISLDLKGFRSGSLNETIDINNE